MDVLGGDFEEPEVDYNPTIRKGSQRFLLQKCKKN